MGAMVGVCLVERAVRFAALRAEQGCGEECRVALGALEAHHGPSCRLSPFALGPFCNIISAAIRLPRPVPCQGKLGCWRLGAAVREEVLAQLTARSPPPCADFEQYGAGLPRAWPPPWLPLAHALLRRSVAGEIPRASGSAVQLRRQQARRVWAPPSKTRAGHARRAHGQRPRAQTGS